MINELSVQKTAEFLTAKDNFLILTHASPDGDTLGSAYALCAALGEKGKKAAVVCPEAIPKKYSYFADCRFGDFTPETIIAVDIADEKLLGPLKEKYEGKIELCIDHHASNIHYAKNLYLNSAAAANCENIYEIILALGVKISKYMADCLFTGLSTDTGCFKYSNTTADTHIIAARLIEAGADSATINKVMFDTKTMGRFKAEKEAMEEIEFFEDGKISLMTVSADLMKRTGCDQSDVDALVSIPRTIEGVVIGITIKEKENDRYKVSLRTNEPADASTICKTFGGGGHIRAAGCEFIGTELEEIKVRLIKAAKAEL